LRDGRSREREESDIKGDGISKRGRLEKVGMADEERERHDATGLR
jgi:hypothetical protein